MAMANLLTVIPVVKAQFSKAQCLSRFDWVRHNMTSGVIDLSVFGQISNSIGQNPCLVAAYAMVLCLGLCKIIISYTA